MSVLALVLFAGAVRAEEPASPPEQDLSEARRLTREGLEAYEGARYPEAIVAFEAAYAIAPLPLLLYNLGQAHRLNGDCASAVRYYERFSETGPTGSVAELVDSRLRELRPCSQAEPATAARQATMPRPAAVSHAPAREEVVALPETRGPRVRTPNVALKPLSGEPRRDALSTEHRSFLWPAILTGGAIALLGTGSYFAWRSDEASDAVSRRFQHRNGTWDASGAAIERQGKLYENVSIAAIAAGALMGGASLWIWSFD